ACAVTQIHSFYCGTETYYQPFSVGWATVDTAFLFPNWSTPSSIVISKMMSHQLSRRPSLLPRGMALVSRPVRTVRMQLFRRDGPVLVEENSVEELNQPTKRQREQIKRTLQELGFTEQAADILAYGKITNSNADLLIGDIRASFGIYQAPPPQGPVETVQNGVQDLLDRLRLPFLGLLLAAGLAAAYSQQVTLLG
ncbi:hypothetical protein Vretifemale_8364, partial [Volvox reticuliferus]